MKRWLTNPKLCNKHAIVREGPGYPSNQSPIGMTFPLVLHVRVVTIILLHTHYSMFALIESVVSFY